VDTNYYQSNQDFQQLHTEKLFSILSQLSSIRNEAKMLPNLDQFILGVETSIEVVESAITGNLYKNKMSILDPNQIPLF
jgi:hypothetical protein